MNWLLKRLSEPSTYAGLAGVIVGAGQLGKINEAPAVADAVAAGGQAVAAGAPAWMAAAAVVTGLLAAFLKEKGGRNG